MVKSLGITKRLFLVGVLVLSFQTNFSMSAIADAVNADGSPMDPSLDPSNYTPSIYNGTYTGTSVDLYNSTTGGCTANSVLCNGTPASDWGSPTTTQVAPVAPTPPPGVTQQQYNQLQQQLQQQQTQNAQTQQNIQQLQNSINQQSAAAAQAAAQAAASAQAAAAGLTASQNAAVAAQAAQNANPSSGAAAAIANSQGSMAACQAAHDAAENCCTNPAQCIPGQNNGDPDSAASTGYQIFTGLLGVATMLPGDAAAMCGRMKDVADVMTAVNLYLATSCTSTVNKCKSACSGGAAANNTANCLALYPKNESAQVLCMTQTNSMSTALSDCKSFDNATSRYAQQAVASQLSAKLSGICQSVANGPPADPFANPDCSTVANAASPFCQYACRQAGASATPQCAGFLALQQQNLQNGLGINGGLPGAGGATTPNGIGANGNPFSNLPVNPENMQQNPTIPNTAATGGHLDTTTGGGGGGQLPSDGSAGGGLGPARSPGAAGGWNADILRGMNSGNGYSQGAGLKTGTAGGFAGYGPAGKTDPLGKPFNLKDFLPGGKNSQLRTTAFRGLASNIADISPAHTDIFQKVTDRFHAVCLRDALYDCATLQKVMKRPIGP